MELKVQDLKVKAKQIMEKKYGSKKDTKFQIYLLTLFKSKINVFTKHKLHSKIGFHKS